jgi:DNA-binding NarL/FixJ family response regulator
MTAGPEPGCGRVRVLIADDDPVFLAALALALERCPAIEVVAVARDGVQAIGLFAETRPDVALVDLAMPRCDGVELTAQLLKTDRDAAVLIVTAESDERILAHCLGMGARGCLRKGLRLFEYAPIAVAVYGGAGGPP